MVTDQEIASCIESLLRQPDGPSDSASASDDVVRRVGAKLGVDLSQKAAFIHDQIDLLRGPPSKDQPTPATASASAAPFQSGQQLPPSPQILLHPLYQMPPGSYPVAFRFPPGPISPVQLQQQHLHQFQQQHLQQFQQQQQMQQQAPPLVAQQPLAGSNPRASVPARIKRRRGPGGLTRLCGVSPELQVIVGEPAMPRTQIVKQLWAYIRKNNLQDPNNKRKIICNDELRLVLETDCTDIFKMNKLLAKHITALESTKDVAPDSKKLKADDDVTETEPDANPCPMVISDSLAEFLGTGEKELLQAEALKRIWDHIKENNLEDQVNTVIMCDSKLQQLFGCENFATSKVSQMLAGHLFEKS